MRKRGRGVLCSLKKKWVNRIKIHDEVATSLAPNVLLRKFFLNKFYNPDVHDMYTHCFICVRNERQFNDIQGL